MPKYPKITDPDFNDEISRIYRKYKIPAKKKTLREICFPKKYTLQNPQKFVSEYLAPQTPYQGLLVFHRIGAGKTCAAVQIAEKWKGKRDIVFLVPASLKGNIRGELRSPCAGNAYLTDAERRLLNNLHPSSPAYKNIIKKSDQRINKYYKIYSYNKFIELALNNKINLRNTMLIIDEVQNMVSEEGTFYEVLYSTIQKAPKSLHVVLLSATPIFDKPVEIALTMNLLPIPKKFPIGSKFNKQFMTETRDGLQAKNMDLFKEHITGFVSYYRGAPPHSFPKQDLKYVRCKMSDFQLKSYKTVLAGEKMRQQGRFYQGGILDLPNNFFLGTRMISNIAFPNRDTGEAGYNSLKKKHMQMKNLKKYSVKFYKILKKLKKSEGPVFIYSNFKEYGGIRSFVKILEAHRFKNYSEHGEGKNRFAVWSGDEKTAVKDEIRAVFNQKQNHNGSKIRVLLGSPSIKEGVTLLRVQQIHILEPYWNLSRLEQVIGRGIRYCSHKDVPADRRIVEVYIYLAVNPAISQTVDQYIQKLALQKNSIVKQFELALKESAVDCRLNLHANSSRAEPIVCDL